MFDAPAPDAPFTWSDAFLLGYGPLDDTHREFVDTVQAMLVASDADFAACLDAFAAHAREHFGSENEWMEKHEFPARRCHIDEHDAVLRSVAEVQALVAQGRFDVGRRLAQELVRWFPMHATHLDSALAHWMSTRQLGGKPVVIRRGVAVSAPAAASSAA